MNNLKLVVFDVDGTMVDSQHTIHAAMSQAFESVSLAPPASGDVRALVGLSLPETVKRLVGSENHHQADAIAEAYRQAYFRLRTAGLVNEPLFPGTKEVLAALQDKGFLLGIATGKSMRGLKATLSAHGIWDYFITAQTADKHPGKPDPSMLLAAMDETGARARDTLLVGDTTFDMQMAKNAGVTALGVAWGYHANKDLKAHGAQGIIEGFDEVVHHALSL